MSLATKYRPKTFEDVTEQSVITEILNSVCKNNNDLSCRNFLLTGPAGCGKAQPLTSKVLTPNGYVLMQDVSIGLEVYNENGDITVIDGIYPQGVRNIYRITFSNKDSIEVSDEHLNILYYNGRRCFIETNDLLKLDDDELMCLSAPIPSVQFTHICIDIHPGLLGVLYALSIRNKLYEHKLDNSHSRIYISDYWYSAQISHFLSHENIKFIEPLDNEHDTWVLNEDFTNKLMKFYNVDSIFTLLEKLKTIPDNIKYNDSETRCTFVDEALYSFKAITNYTKETIEFEGFDNDTEFKFLVESLGYMYENRILKSYIRMSSCVNNSFKRTIESIQCIGEMECQCIHVKDMHHSYISDCMIPTHNTTCARIMSNMLNSGLGEPIEIDAASHGNVESIRDLVQQAQQYPIGQKYKIFIIDECFYKDTKIKTPYGDKKISDIKIGDKVYNMDGESTVTNVFVNHVLKNDLVLLKTSNSTTLTTKQHLFFTEYGWVACKDLKQGDILYDYKNMYDMWKTIPNQKPQTTSVWSGVWRNTETSEFKENCEEKENGLYKDVSDMWKDFLYNERYKCYNVFSEMCRDLQKSTRAFSKAERLFCYAQVGFYLSYLWETDEDFKIRPSSYVWSRLCKEISEITKTETKRTKTKDNKEMCSLWKRVRCNKLSIKENLLSRVQKYSNWISTTWKKISRNIKKDVRKQSNVQSREYRKNETNKTEKWNFAQCTCNTWREWYIYGTPDEIVQSAYRKYKLGLDTGIPDSNRLFSEERNELSDLLQNRYRLRKSKVGNRGGWQGTPDEIQTSIRFKERKSSGTVRVEDIEVYKRGDNDELFTSYFSDSDISSSYIDMYDLEINGNPSYFANEVLVHNCHSLSNTAWQSLLRTLESSPAKTVWIFCTTNPEKIPQTIISRIQTFQLSKISLQGIYDRLIYVLESENKEGKDITYTEDAVMYIAKMANGGMRDSLTLLDKALAYSKDLTITAIVEALNLPNYDDYFALLSAYAKKDNEEIAKIIDMVYNSGTNFIKWFEEFHSFVMNIVKYILLKDINKTMVPSIYTEKISKYNEKHVIVCLHLANILIQMNQELRNTQYLQELALTYLCTIPKIK